jgi:pimeloyl-ACP methyl ester carboxylesterase
MNTDLHIVEIGQGEPIVFIHGSFDPAQETFSEQKNLADEYRVILVDRRGYGESPSAGSLDFDAQVADILRVMGDGAHLVGHSYDHQPSSGSGSIGLSPRELLHSPHAARRFDGSSVPHQVQL